MALMTDQQIAHFGRRYLEGASSAELGAELGITSRTLRRRLRHAGVPLRPPAICEGCGKRVRRKTRLCHECRRLYPKPTARVCELEGCDVFFTPPGARVARGGGRFCCYSHWNEWRRGKPQRAWKAKAS